MAAANLVTVIHPPTCYVLSTSQGTHQTDYPGPPFPTTPTSLAEWVEEVCESAGHAADDVAGVTVLWEQEGQLEVRLLLQTDLSPVTAGQLIRRALRHTHHALYELLGDLWLPPVRDVVLQQGTQLQGVEFEAGGTDAGDVISTALGGLEEVGRLQAQPPQSTHHLTKKPTPTSIIIAY